MSKFKYLSLSALLVTSAAWPMKFSAPLNKLKLPLILSTEQPPAVKYVPPGEISVSALRMCGDYDVEHFSEAHENFEFMPHEQKDVDVIIGYWVVKEGDAILPTQDNWTPVAYQKIPIAEKAPELQHKGRFLPFSYNQVGPNTNAMGLVEPELKHLQKLSKQAFGANDSYRVFAGVFGCHQPDEAEALKSESESSYQYRGTPVQNLASLSSLNAVVDSAFGGSVADIISNNKLNINVKANVADRNLSSDFTPTPYDYSFGTSGEALGSLYDKAKSILELSYPSDAADVEAYKTALASSLKTELSGHTGDKINFCNTIGANSNKTAKSYSNLEAFPLNLTCKNLYNGSDFANSYKALFEPDAKPDAAAFASAQKNLAKRFYLAAAYQAAQQKFNNQGFARTGCFAKSGQQLIGRLMATYPLKFSLKNDKWVLENNENNHLHPESLFALRDFTNYFNHPVLAIWGQVERSQGSSDPNVIRNKGMLLKLDGTGKDMQNSSAPVNINFKIRSVGGSCTVFC